MKKVNYLIRKLKEYNNRNKEKKETIIIDCYADDNNEWLSDEQTYMYENKAYIGECGLWCENDKLENNIKDIKTISEMREKAEKYNFNIVIMPCGVESIEELFKDEIEGLN
jgi:hypothetical protein